LEAGLDELERRMALTMAEEDAFEARLGRITEGLISFQHEHMPMLKVLMRSLLDQDATSVAFLNRSLVPLVDRVEEFIRSAADPKPAPDFPVRAAILQQVVAQLVRSAMGGTGEQLWRGDAHTWTLTQALLRGASQSE
jgi:hypothetical protein